MRFLKNMLEHNEHYIEINLFGKKIKPCARCFGKIIGIVVSLILSLPFVFGYIKIDFITGFIASWILALPAIIDWSSVKLRIRKGSNKIRFITGFLLGCGITTYFLIMPAPILFKVLTFILYEFIFTIIYIHSKFGLVNSIKNTINYIKSKPSIYGCKCGWGCCCPCIEGCYGGCINALICTFLACLTIPCCCLLGEGSCGICRKKGG